MTGARLRGAMDGDVRAFFITTHNHHTQQARKQVVLYRLRTRYQAPGSIKMYTTLRAQQPHFCLGKES